MHNRFPRLRRLARLAIRWAARISVAALAVAVHAAAAQDDKSGPAATTQALSLNDAERHDAISRALAHPAVQQAAAGHRLAGIRAVAVNTTDASGQGRTLLTVVLFDHTALEARRVTIDAVTNALVANELLPGHPQSSPEELEEATALVRRDAALATLLDQGAVLDGGFIVDDPGGSRRRMIQLKLMSGDRRTALRTITVDLTLRRIAANTSVPSPSPRRVDPPR